MKKLTILLAFASLFATGCKNNEKKAVAVPEAVISALNTKYPGAGTIKWDQETTNNQTLYDGSFTVDGKNKEAQFDDQGNFIKEK